MPVTCSNIVNFFLEHFPLSKGLLKMREQQRKVVIQRGVRQPCGGGMVRWSAWLKSSAVHRKLTVVGRKFSPGCCLRCLRPLVVLVVGSFVNRWHIWLPSYTKRMWAQRLLLYSYLHLLYSCSSSTLLLLYSYSTSTLLLLDSFSTHPLQRLSMI